MHCLWGLIDTKRHLLTIGHTNATKAILSGLRAELAWLEGKADGRGVTCILIDRSRFENTGLYNRVDSNRVLSIFSNAQWPGAFEIQRRRGSLVLEDKGDRIGA